MIDHIEKNMPEIIKTVFEDTLGTVSVIFDRRRLFPIEPVSYEISPHKGYDDNSGELADSSGISDTNSLLYF